MHVYIEDIGKHDGSEVTIKGWLHNRRSSGKIHFLIVRDGTGFIQAVMSKAAVGDEAFKNADHLSQETSLIVTGTVRADKRAPSGYEIDVKQYRDRRRVEGLSDHAEGTRRRLPARSPASLDSHRTSARHSPRASRGDQRRPRLFQRARVHPCRYADLHAGCLRGDDDAVPRAVLRGSNGVSDAERSAVQRSERDGARQGVLLRPDVSRGEVEDAAPPHRVLDGRTRNGIRRARRRDESRGGPARRDRRARARQAAARARKCSSATHPSSSR